MNRHILFILLGTFALGCGGSEKTATPDSDVEREGIQTERRGRVNRELAQQHFIEGSLLDSKGDYAKAILEYQDALRFDNDPAIHYALSRDYALLGKHSLAAQHAREAITLDSLNVAYHEQLAVVYLNAYQQDLAIREYETIVRLDSNYVDGWYNLARLYQPTRPLKALEIYERLLEKEGDRWELLLMIADLYYAMGRFDEAADRYQRMLEQDPSNRALQRQLAETYVRAGSTSQAIEVFESMVEIDDTDVEILASLADLYLQERQFDKALPLYQKVLARVRDNPEVKLRVGVSYFGQIQSDTTFIPKARKILLEVAEQLPNDWRPFFYLGAIASTKSEDSLAATYFTRVTELEKKNFEAWWFLGSFYFERNEFEKSVNLMKEARSVLPNEHRFYFLEGLAYTRLNKNQEAIEVLEKGLSLEPDNLDIIGTLALTYDGIQQYDKSDALYEHALEIDPGSHIILNNYGYSLSERGIQLDRALEMSLQAVEADPDNSSYLDTLGWVYYQLGRYVEAEKYILQSIATGDASAVVREHLGDVYYRLGKIDQARQAWEQALEMDSTNDALREKLARGTP